MPCKLILCMNFFQLQKGLKIDPLSLCRCLTMEKNLVSLKPLGSRIVWESTFKL